MNITIEDIAAFNQRYRDELSSYKLRMQPGGKHASKYVARVEQQMTEIERYIFRTLHVSFRYQIRTRRVNSQSPIPTQSVVSKEIVRDSHYTQRRRNSPIESLTHYQRNRDKIRARNKAAYDLKRAERLKNQPPKQYKSEYYARNRERFIAEYHRKRAEKS